MARFAERAPVPMMARLAVQRALDPNWIDPVFEGHCRSQYTRELLVSSVVEIMPVVAMGLRPSLHAAAKAYHYGRQPPARKREAAQALRQFRGAALPGHSLVVYDPDSGLVIDLISCEGAYAQERASMPPILERVQRRNIASLYRRRWRIEKVPVP